MDLSTNPLLHSRSVWLVALLGMFPADGAVAADVADVVGQWTLSLDSTNWMQHADLMVESDGQSLTARLRSELGSAKADFVTLDGDRLSIRYRVDGRDVRIDFTIASECMSGSIVTGEGEMELHRPVIATRPEEIPPMDSLPAPDSLSKVGPNADLLRDFLGNWELTLQNDPTNESPRVKMGWVVCQREGRVVVLHTSLGMREPNRQVEKVRFEREGMHWEFDGGLFGPLQVVFSRSGETRTVRFTNAIDQTFLVGTAVRKASDRDVGIDASVLLKAAEMPLIGMIKEPARVVDATANELVLQQGRTIAVLIKGNPLLVNFQRFQIAEDARLMFIDNGHAGIMTGQKLEILDVSTPSHPRSIGACRLPGNPPAVVKYQNGLLFAANWNGQADTQQLHLIDVSDPSDPKLVFSHDTPQGASNYDITIAGSTVYLANANGLRILSVQDARKPILRANFRCHGHWVRGVDVVGSKAFVATSMHGDASWMQIIDVSDPTSPRELGIYRTTGGAQDVAVTDRVAYVADQGDGIVELDITDPANPRRTGFQYIEGQTKKIYLLGDVAFASVRQPLQDVLAVIRCCGE